MANRKPIHCIGDSHVSLFSGKDEVIPVWNEPHEDLLPQFRTYRLGAFLAYNLATPNHEGRDKLFRCIKSLPKNSKVLLCFGEIDCRAHIVKQALAQDRAISDVAMEVATRYAGVIEELREFCKPAVWGATPQSAAQHSSNKFPTVGTMQERNEATRTFNDTLMLYGEAKHVWVFQIHHYIVSKGVSDESYFLDSAHLNQRALPLALEELAPFLK